MNTYSCDFQFTLFCNVYEIIGFQIRHKNILKLPIENKEQLNELNSKLVVLDDPQHPEYESSRDNRDRMVSIYYFMCGALYQYPFCVLTIIYFYRYISLINVTFIFLSGFFSQIHLIKTYSTNPDLYALFLAIFKRTIVQTVSIVHLRDTHLYNLMKGKNACAPYHLTYLLNKMYECIPLRHYSYSFVYYCLPLLFLQKKFLNGPKC